MSKVSAQDVLSFFEDAELEVAKLVHEFAGTKLAVRSEKKDATSEKMKKARAARKPKGSVGNTASTVPGTPVTQVEVPV